MKITFIKPGMGEKKSYDAMEPLVFAILKAITPKEHEVILYDDRLEEIPYDEITNLVAITVETFTAKRAYAIAFQFRKRKIPVIMGGFHPTMVPSESIQYCDSIVIQDAENLWPNILDDVVNHRLQKIYKNDNLPPLDNIIPDRSIFVGKKYKNLHLIQFSRGCKYACDFCSISSFYGKSLRFRPVQDVLLEIKNLKFNNLLFVDDNIFSNRTLMKELLIALIPLKKRWICQISIDVARDDEILSLMKQSGCLACIIGLESLREQNLVQMKKKWNHQIEYSKAIKHINNYEIMVLGTFVLGYDFDDITSFDEILKFSIKNKLFLAHFNPLSPTPGTPLFDRLKSENRLINDPWWLNDNYKYGKAMFKPAKLSSEQFEQACFENRKQFNSLSSIIFRLFNKAHLTSFANFYFFLGANFITRKAIRFKQGLSLGKQE